MALIIPAAGATYGDSTKTEGGALRKYVLAQFRDDANLDWVRDLRGVLVKQELKYQDVVEARTKLKQNRRLWARVEGGVGQASIIVIDPQPLETAIREMATAEGMVEGHDFDERRVIDECATAVVAGTPLAYLPHNLVRLVPWELCPVGDLNTFTPEALRKQIGGGLAEAKIFAARAHAIFDLTQADSTITSTTAVFQSPLARVMLAELLATPRIYDRESPGTLPVLNEAALAIASAIEDGFPESLTRKASPLVAEIDSRGIDQIQAADIAAGWTREILDAADPRALGSRFERVWVNGNRIK